MVPSLLLHSQSTNQISCSYTTTHLKQSVICSTTSCCCTVASYHIISYHIRSQFMLKKELSLSLAKQCSCSKKGAALLTCEPEQQTVPWKCWQGLAGYHTGPSFDERTPTACDLWSAWHRLQVYVDVWNMGQQCKAGNDQARLKTTLWGMHTVYDPFFGGGRVQCVIPRHFYGNEHSLRGTLGHNTYSYWQKKPELNELLSRLKLFSND